jgi:hypothetical protein
MDVSCQLRKLNTSGRGAGWVAQAWVWPRDLTSEEVRELWMFTRDRYPRAKRGLPAEGLGQMPYRPPPNPFATTKVNAPGPGEGVTSAIVVRPPKDHRFPHRTILGYQPPPPTASVIEKQMESMLEVPLQGSHSAHTPPQCRALSSLTIAALCAWCTRCRWSTDWPSSAF